VLDLAKNIEQKKKVREGGEDGCPLVSVFFGFSRIWAARLILSPANCNSKQRMQVPVQVCLLVTFASYFELIWLLHPVLYIILFISQSSLEVHKHRPKPDYG
jgi:hypothetical protein